MVERKYKMITKYCTICGIKFECKATCWRSKIYCTDKCSQKVHYKRNRQKLGKTPLAK